MNFTPLGQSTGGGAGGEGGRRGSKINFLSDVVVSCPEFGLASDQTRPDQIIMALESYALTHYALGGKGLTPGLPSPKPRILSDHELL